MYTRANVSADLKNVLDAMTTIIHKPEQVKTPQFLVTKKARSMASSPFVLSSIRAEAEYWNEINENYLKLLDEHEKGVSAKQLEKYGEAYDLFYVHTNLGELDSETKRTELRESIEENNEFISYIKKVESASTLLCKKLNVTPKDYSLDKPR